MSNKKTSSATAVAIVTPAIPPKLKTGDDAQVKQTFQELFEGAQNGLRAVVAFGLYAEEIKQIKLKHGKFKDWLGATFPEVSYRSVVRHMELATSVMKACGVKSLKPFFKSATCGTFEHAGMLLTAPEKKCDEKAIEIRTKVFSLIDGKSARQLFFEFKQGEEDEDGNVKTKRGRLKGQGGASAAQRAKAKAAADAAEIEARELKAEEIGEWVKENVDDQHIGQISDKHKAILREAALLLTDYLKHNGKDSAK